MSGPGPNNPTSPFPYCTCSTCQGFDRTLKGRRPVPAGDPSPDLGKGLPGIEKAGRIHMRAVKGPK